ncbi:MAG: EAL domain-containing protein [Polyangiaceae bacterium]|nr:EAL domain-containing protein [Polyangiaceae bacterium]
MPRRATRGRAGARHGRRRSPRTRRTPSGRRRARRGRKRTRPRRRRPGRGARDFAQLEPDIAKNDISLVRGVDQGPHRARIINGIVPLCHDLGLIVVAEGVETIGKRDELLRVGCDLFHGYLVAKPSAGFPLSNWPGAGTE